MAVPPQQARIPMRHGAFPRGEEKAYAGSGPVERICAFLSVGCLCAAHPSVVRQCPAPPRGSLGAYMEFIYPRRFSAVEFLWRPGPLSRRYEKVPSCLPERGRLHATPRQRSPTVVSGRQPHDLRGSATRRGAWRDRPDPGRASGRGGRGHPDPSGVRHRIDAAVHRPLQNGSAPTMSTCESFLCFEFMTILVSRMGVPDARHHPDRGRLRLFRRGDRLCLRL